jgi:hypothetical protein
MLLKKVVKNGFLSWKPEKENNKILDSPALSSA